MQRLLNLLQISVIMYHNINSSDYEMVIILSVVENFMVLNVIFINLIYRVQLKFEKNIWIICFKYFFPFVIKNI